MTGKPPHCGTCDPATRLVETTDDKAVRCPRCHPNAPRTLPALIARRDWLAAELDEVRRLIAAAEVPDWQRGPDWRRR